MPKAAKLKGNPQTSKLTAFFSLRVPSSSKMSSDASIPLKKSQFSATFDEDGIRSTSPSTPSDTLSSTQTTNTYHSLSSDSQASTSSSASSRKSCIVISSDSSNTSPIIPLDHEPSPMISATHLPVSAPSTVIHKRYASDSHSHSEENSPSSGPFRGTPNSRTVKPTKHKLPTSIPKVLQNSVSLNVVDPLRGPCSPPKSCTPAGLGDQDDSLDIFVPSSPPIRQAEIFAPFASERQPRPVLSSSVVGESAIIIPSSQSDENTSPLRYRDRSVSQPTLLCLQSEAKVNDRLSRDQNDSFVGGPARKRRRLDEGSSSYSVSNAFTNHAIANDRDKGLLTPIRIERNSHSPIHSPVVGNSNTQIPTPPNTLQRTQRYIDQLKARVAADVSLVDEETNPPNRTARGALEDSSDDEDIFVPRVTRKNIALTSSPLTDLSSDSDEEKHSTCGSVRRAQSPTVEHAIQKKTYTANQKLSFLTKPKKAEFDFMSLVEDRKKAGCTPPISEGIVNEAVDTEQPNMPDVDRSGDESLDSEEIIEPASVYTIWRDALEPENGVDVCIRNCCEGMEHITQNPDILADVLGRFNLSLLSESKGVTSVKWLLAQVFSPCFSPAAQNAARVLTQLYNSDGGRAPVITFQHLLYLVMDLGISMDTIAMFGWLTRTSLSYQPQQQNSYLREVCLSRALRVVKAGARAQRILPAEVPWHAQAALLIALDATCPPELEHECCAVIHELFSGANKSTLDQFFVQTLPWLRAQSLQVQTHCLTLLQEGSQNGAMVVRWLAWSLLTGLDYAKKQFVPQPPLGDLLPLFYPTAAEEGASFVIDASTDYITLTSRTELLGLVLFQPELYFDRSASSTTVKSSSEAGDMDLIISGLRNAHSQIRDMRATHVDRTRAKSVIHKLAMRLHYQLESIKKGSTSGRPGGIRVYLAQKK